MSFVSISYTLARLNDFICDFGPRVEMTGPTSVFIRITDLTTVIYYVPEQANDR